MPATTVPSAPMADMTNQSHTALFCITMADMTNQSPSSISVATAHWQDQTDQVKPLHPWSETETQGLPSLLVLRVYNCTHEPHGCAMSEMRHQPSNPDCKKTLIAERVRTSETSQHAESCSS